MHAAYELGADSTIKQQKNKLRQYIRDQREIVFAKNPAYREVASCIIANTLYSLDEYNDAKVLLFFVGKQTEVNTLPMIYHTLDIGKKAAVTVMEPDTGTLRVSLIKEIDELYEMQEANFHVLEPTPEYQHIIKPRKVDTALIPFMAAAKKKIKAESGIRRLGYGAGYYDRFIGKLRKNTPKIGLGLGLQLVDNVPVNGKDHYLDMIITEKRIIK